MKKLTVSISSVSLLFLLSACGGDDDNSNATETTGQEENTSETNEENGSATTAVGGYSEFATIPVDGRVSDPVFYISGEGDTVLWAEQPGEFTQIEGSKVWFDGETKEVDLPERDPAHQPMLSRSGKILFAESDRDKPEEERYWITEQDPVTGESNQFIMDNDWDVYTPVMGSNYSEDPRFYVGVKDHYDEEVVLLYTWHVDNGEVEEIDLTETVAAEVDIEELTFYPHGSITNDESTIYAVLADVGILKIDLASHESEFIYSAEPGFFSNNEKSQTHILTADDQYILYAIFDEDTRRMTHWAYDITADESINLGEGIATYPLDDGNVMLFTYDDEFVYFDLESETDEVVHTPELTEDDRLDSFTVSADGSTLAYVVRDEENESTIVLQRQ